MQVPLLDLKAQYRTIEREINEAIRDVLDSQRFILGPKVEEIEKATAEYCQCRYAVGVSSGTDALLVSLMAAGVGIDDVVITTPYTFFATGGAVARLGARPLFVDIDCNTYNMDAAELGRVLENLGDAERERVKAVIPIHLFGQCAPMEEILEAASRYGLTVIEDAAQAIGSEYEFGDGTTRRAGAMGEYGCFSFFPSKNLGAFGDAGMVTTNDPEIYDRVKTLRVHGAQPKYYHQMVGGNFRLDAIQAAVLVVKLKYLDRWTEQRRKNAALYRQLFQEAGASGIGLPTEEGKRHIYNQFVIRVGPRRDALKAHLGEKGVGTEIYYPVPLHLQRCFDYLGYGKEEFPVSRQAAMETLALPIYPELTEDQIRYVVDTIEEFMAS